MEAELLVLLPFDPHCPEATANKYRMFTPCAASMSLLKYTGKSVDYPVVSDTETSISTIAQPLAVWTSDVDLSHNLVTKQTAR